MRHEHPDTDEQIDKLNRDLDEAYRRIAWLKDKVDALIAQAVAPKAAPPTLKQTRVVLPTVDELLAKVQSDPLTALPGQRVTPPTLEEIKALAAQVDHPTIGGVQDSVIPAAPLVPASEIAKTADQQARWAGVTPQSELAPHEQAVVDTFGGGAAPEIPGQDSPAELKMTTKDAAQLEDALDDTDGRVLPGLKALLDTPAPWDTTPQETTDVELQPGDPGFVAWYQGRVNRHDPSTGVRTSTRASQGM